MGCKLEVFQMIWQIDSYAAGRSYRVEKVVSQLRIHSVYIFECCTFKNFWTCSRGLVKPFQMRRQLKAGKYVSYRSVSSRLVVMLGVESKGGVFAAFPPRHLPLAVVLCMDVGMRWTARFVSFIMGSKSTPTCSIKHWKNSIPGPYKAPVQ